MANALTIVSTWDSNYVAENFLTPALVTGGLFNGGYRVDPLVNKKKTFYVGSELSQIVFKKETCGFSPNGTSEMTEVSLETQPMAINLEQCAAEYFDTIFKETLKKGSNIYDLTGTVIEEFVRENYLRSLTNDTYILAWFANTATTGIPFLTPFNGWFTLFESDSAVEKISIGSTGDWALNALRTAYQSETGQLIRQQTNPVIKVTPNMYYNLLVTFENTGTDYGLARLSDGGVLTFRGIPVEEETVWGKAIRVNGLANDKRMFFGDLQNLHVGTDIANPGSDAKMFLHELEEKTYFKMNFDLGVTYTHSNLIIYGRG